MKTTRASISAALVVLAATPLFAQVGVKSDTKAETMSAAAAPAQKAEAPHGEVKSALEGTSWQVHVVPDKDAIVKGEKEFDDTIVFHNGKVSMSECVKYGFEPTVYNTSKKADRWTFKTAQMSKDHGKNAWAAEIVGEKINGTVQWTKGDGTIYNYTFEGVKKTKS